MSLRGVLPYRSNTIFPCSGIRVIKIYHSIQKMSMQRPRKSLFAQIVTLICANRVYPIGTFLKAGSRCCDGVSTTLIIARLAALDGTSTLPRTSFLSWPLITSSFSCTIFSDMVYRLLSECYQRLKKIEFSDNKAYTPRFTQIGGCLV